MNKKRQKKPLYWREPVKKPLIPTIEPGATFDNQTCFKNVDLATIEKIVDKHLEKRKNNDGKDITGAYKLTIKQFLKLYKKVSKYDHLKKKVSDAFFEYIRYRSEKHTGEEQEFVYLVNSVILYGNNPFYVDYDVDEFLSTLLSWGKPPFSFDTMCYLFDCLFYGPAFKDFKDLIARSEVKYSVFKSREVLEKVIFDLPNFSMEFPGKTKKERETFRKDFLIKIFNKMVDCVKNAKLDIGDSECCQQRFEESLNRIRKTHKYLELLEEVEAVDDEFCHEKSTILETKKIATIENNRKWKNLGKVTCLWLFFIILLAQQIPQ